MVCVFVFVWVILGVCGFGLAGVLLSGLDVLALTGT